MRKIKFYNKKFLVLCLTGLICSLSFIFNKNLSARDSVAEFAARIDSIVSYANCKISVQIASADKYDLLYEHNPQEQMIPASITKLVTAAAAIHYLGVGYEFKTIVFTDDSNIKDGVVNGNIYLKGYGDPDLSSGDIAELAEKIAEKNITEITGNIIYDDSFLDNEYYSLANYYKGDTHQNYWPYVSGINLNKNPGSSDPAATAAGILSGNLISANVKLGGIVTSGVTPPAANEIADVSHTLFQVISRMNKESDNHSAITVFKVVGAKFSSAPGSISKGQEAVLNFLTSIGNPRNSFEILEGSGLSRFNSVNSDLYIRLLKYMYDNIETFDYFYNSLSIAGVDGTLRNRMVGTEAEKNVHAKTGTLNSVSALSGYAVSRDRELILFYIDMNGFGSGANMERYGQDLICEAICQFSRK